MKAIIHKNHREPTYIEITECEEDQVEITKEKLTSFGSRVILVMDAKDVHKLEAYIASFGGGPVGLV